MPVAPPTVAFADRPPPWRLFWYGPLAVECFLVSLPLVRNHSLLAAVPIVFGVGLLVACWIPDLAPLLLVFTCPAWLLMIMLSSRWLIAGGLVDRGPLAWLLIFGLPVLAIVRLILDTVRYGYRGGKSAPEHDPVMPVDE